MAFLAEISRMLSSRHVYTTTKTWPKCIHAQGCEPYFIGIIVFNGNRGVVKENGDSVRERYSVLADVQFRLIGIPLVSHVHYRMHIRAYCQCPS